MTAPDDHDGLTAEDLRRLLAGATDPAHHESTRAWVHRAVPETVFTWPDGLTQYERAELAYTRCRQMARHALPAAELLAEPANLAALMTRVVVAGPSMFHFCMVHYALTLAPLLAADPAGDVPELRAHRSALETMRTFGVALLTEATEYSSSHLRPRTTAEFDPGTKEFVLHSPDRGAAKFPNNTACPTIPKTAAVYAQLVTGGEERGMFVFLVPLRDSDGRLAPRIELSAAPDNSVLPSDYATVRFDRLRVPWHSWLSDGAHLDADGILHDPEPSTAARRTRTMRVAGPLVWTCIVAASAGVVQATATILHSYARRHRSGGALTPETPLLHQRPIRDAVIATTAAGYALAVLSTRTTSGSAPPTGDDAVAALAPWTAIDHRAVLLKVHANRLCTEVVTAARILCGASGFTATDRLNTYIGWAASYDSGGGANDLVLLDTARAMVDGIVYTAPDSAQSCVGGALTGGEVSASILRSLEGRLHADLVAGLTNARAEGTPEPDFWARSHALALLTATVYADRVALESLLAAGLPRPVDRLVAVHALSRLHQHAAALVDYGVVELGLLARIRSARATLCDELAPHLDTLVAAIDVPDLGV